MAPNSLWPVSSLNLRSGSGMVRPRYSAWGTVWSTMRWRSSSFENSLMRHCADWALLTDSASDGPNIIRDGHHQRLRASCAIAFCSGVPLARLIMMSYPWRAWKDSSLQTRIMARAYGPYEQRQRGIWLMMAEPSTSQPIAPMSAQLRVG